MFNINRYKEQQLLKKGKDQQSKEEYNEKKIIGKPDICFIKDTNTLLPTGKDINLEDIE